MSRRVVIGKYNDGVTYGLRCSLPGYDALTDSSAGGDFSFDSSWTDISKIHQVGLVSFATTQANVFWTSLGYMPFLEIRKYVGNVVYDDYWNSFLPYGADAFLFTDANLRVNNPAGAAATFMYIIYKIPVPSG